MSIKSVTFSGQYMNEMVAIPRGSVNSFLNIPVPKSRAQGEDIWSGW